MQSLKNLLVPVVVLVATGCAPGNGDGLDDNGRPLGETGANVALAASLESLQVNLFTPNCAVSGCHSGGSSPLGLDLSNDNSYANLVNIASVQQPGKLRVEPGDADNSYLVQKLRGDSGITGERMPRDGARLDQALIDSLVQWINNGAPRTSSAVTASAPVVSSASIAVNQSLNALPASIDVSFSLAMDGSTLVDQTLQLLASGQDGVFDDGNESPLIVQPALSTDGLILTLDLSANAAVGDTTLLESYRLTISGTGPAVARGSNVQVLDGDNDGQAGGDFVLQFTIVDVLLPEFSSLETRFFVPNCAKSGCHSGSFPAAGLNLEAGNVFANTVGVTSAFQPTTQRIVPGNADASAIVQAIEGTTTAIPRMPFDNPGSIPQADIDILRQWIDSGANP